MKENKGVYVTKRDIKQYIPQREYQLYSNRIITGFDEKYGVAKSKNVGVQYNSKRDNLICTCRNLSGLRRQQETRYFSGYQKIYGYHNDRSRSFTDIGVGSVKAFQKKKVKRIYLPETEDRGVGSSDLSFLTDRRNRQQNGSFYDHKQTSSKCVGGFMDNIECVISAQISPILHTQTVMTSPKASNTIVKQNKNEINSNMEKKLVTAATQMNTEDVKEDKPNPTETKAQMIPKHLSKPTTQKSNITRNEVFEKNCTDKKIKEMRLDKSFSSDSLVQHVHNLENPSEVKSIEMENKLEMEYRKIFAPKSKDKQSSSNERPIPDLKSTSLLKRRFEALRRSLGKKEDSNAIVQEKDSKDSVQHRDVSISSDPPSLEARSFFNAKKYSYNPYPSTIVPTTQESYKKSYTGKRDSRQWSQANTIDSEYAQGVKGMFKLWGKKFNLEENYHNKVTTPKQSPYKHDYYEKGSTLQSVHSKKIDQQTVNTKKREEIVSKPQIKDEPSEEKKKEKKKFSFFKKKPKNKEKTNDTYKSKNGVTTGRCEVKDGLMIKIGAAKSPPALIRRRKLPPQAPESYEEIMRRSWLMKYLTTPIDSRNSVQVRWNNKTYTTSSSTIFELMENVYKETGVVFKSKSEIITEDTSYATEQSSYSEPRNVNFVQNIEAWMVPTITDQPFATQHQKSRDKDMEDRFSNPKWLIDKSKAFARKIELILHSNNVVRMNNAKCSSGFIRINIPTGFFSDTSTDNTQLDQTSNEEVYKIVEYETSKSSSDFKKSKRKGQQDGDHAANDNIMTIQKGNCIYHKPEIIETVIKRPPMHRDVVIQGSKVNIPSSKRYDVGIGIITQRETREVAKPKLKTVEYSDESDGNHIEPKKCIFAQTFLKDHYKYWTIPGVDPFPWCVSDSHLKCSSENNSLLSLSNGDGCKSCPNIYEDYLTSAFVASCPVSSCSQCLPTEKPVHPPTKSKFFNFLKRQMKLKSDVRVLPKDSVEVFKKRKLYADSNKANWINMTDDTRPYSTPSMEEKSAQDTRVDGPKLSRIPCKDPKSSKKKHVSLPDCEVMGDMLTKQLQETVPGILMFKRSSGCDSCKKSNLDSPKQATVDSDAAVIPDPSCTKSCEAEQKPTFLKENSPLRSPPLSPNMSREKVCCKNRGNSKSPPDPRLQSTNSKMSPSSSLILCKSPKESPNRKSPSKLSPSHSNNSSQSSLCSESLPCTKKKKEKKKKSVTCKTSPCKDIKPSKKKLPTKVKSTTPPCSTPPCKPSLPDCSGCKSSPCNKKASEEFPWPTKNQISNRSSREFISPCKPKEECLKNCPISPKALSSFDTSKKKYKKYKDCVSDCVNKPKVSSSTPTVMTPTKDPGPNPPSLGLQCPKECVTRSKISGLFLKKLPSKKKTCADDCKAWSNLQDQEGVIRLSSREKITIRMKKQTPSTEEIRECVGLKIKDENGQTICERKDYGRLNAVSQPTPPSNLPPGHSWCKSSCERNVLVDGMYKDSQINRVATIHKDETIDRSEEKIDIASDSSVANTIEINFKLKITHGDKTTEVNIGNDDKNNSVRDRGRKTSQEVFVMKDNAQKYDTRDSNDEDNHDKNDVNINILIKNYKHKSNRKKRAKCSTKHTIDDEFSNKISEKFHTVSTGYSSDFRDENSEMCNIYSVHRATIDLTTSAETHKAKFTPSDEINLEVAGHIVIQSEEIDIQNATEPGLESITLIQDSELKVVDAEDNKITTIFDSNEGSEKGQTEYHLNQVSDTDVDKQGNKTSDEGITDVSNKKSEDQDTDICAKTSDERNTDLTEKTSEDLPNYRREEKKQLLKRVFEKANDLQKSTNMSRIRKLKDILKRELKSILTSDSNDTDEMVVASNELVNDLIYPSLKPNFFKNSESLNNYYKGDSNIESDKSSDLKPRYPTGENNSICSEKQSDEWSEEDDKGCVCSTLAAKLNSQVCGGGCCCTQKAKKAKKAQNEETNCDLRTADNYYLLNLNSTEYVDIETQNSNLAASKTTNVSMCTSVPMTNTTIIGFNTDIVVKSNKSVVNDFESQTNLDESSVIVERSSIRVVKTPITVENTDSKENKSDISGDKRNIQLCLENMKNEEIKKISIKRTLSRHLKDMKQYELKTIDNNTKLGISDDDKVVFLEQKSKLQKGYLVENKKPQNTKGMPRNSADILQLYETKKAVLAIYTEKSNSKDGHPLVAKLPKFVYKNDSDNSINHEEIPNTRFKLLHNKNFVMMSVGR